jgi:hypothetical protein
MKYIITILLLLTTFQAESETNDLNIYGTYPGISYSIEFSIEYSVLNTEVLGIESTTYLKYGTSVIGFQGIGVMNNYPIIGFVQYFGSGSGFEIGASYFRRHFVGSYNNEPGEPHNKGKDQLIGMEIGYRDYYNDNAIFRFTFTPFYSFDDPPEDGLSYLKHFYLFLSFSVGYSF